jgi:hypothetical protein
MFEVFRGWKRKSGCATLVISCVFAVGWVRSLKTFEEASYPLTNKTEWYFFSGGGLLEFGRCIAQSPPYLTGKSYWIVAPHQYHQDMSEGLKDIKWYWRISNFGIGSSSRSNQLIDEVVVMPYWSVVIPMTAISAWLLLSKPQTKIAPPITPASENV